MENSLGGDMSQDRLDRIKAAWMDRNDKTEQEWDNFKPYFIPTPAQEAAGNHGQLDSFDEIAAKMEFIFCPDEREMGWRYRTKARHFLHLSEKNMITNPVQAAEYRRESVFWDELSRACFKQADDNRRKL